MESDMETKEAKGPVTAAEGMKVDAIESMTELYTNGIERLAEVQKKGLEIAVKHNTEVASAWKKFALPMPGVLMLDLATTAFERFADTQKGAIDLMVEQTHTFSKLVKERKVKTTDTLEEGKKRAKEAIEHSVEAQKTALDYTAKQTKAAFETAKQQLGYAGTPAGTAADSMERGMDILVEAHKDLLDLVAEPVLH
jgi:ATP-dependent Zn protease